MPIKGSKSASRLSKAALVQRLDERSQKRYGGRFTKALLEDLIKDGLLPALQRERNIGLIPVFKANAAHYRRALQIKRLMARGIHERDRLRIQLFLRGYGIEPWDVRDALRREYAKHVRTVSAQLRSGYIDNTQEIGPSHKLSLQKQLGPLDERLQAAGLEMSPDHYIQFGRSAKLPSGVRRLVAGWLYVDPDSGALAEHFERALQQPDEKFLRAREAFYWIDKHIYFRVLKARIIQDPIFATIVLMVIVECVRSGFPGRLALQEIPRLFLTNFLQATGHGGMRERFYNLLAGIRRALTSKEVPQEGGEKTLDKET
jgi:hypothetical protein